MLRRFGIVCIVCLSACRTTPAPVAQATGAETTVTASVDSGSSALPDTADAVVAQIRKEYQSIQSDPTLTRKAISYETPPDAVNMPPMGGTLTLFFRNGQVVKVLDDGGEDHGVWKEEYYYRPGGELFFIYADNAYGGAANPTEIKYQLRLYLHEGRVYKTLTTQSADNALDTDDYLRKAKAFYNARTAADILAVYQ
ncbi:MAG: hypothetical protein EOP52_02995 [Sphingobacteriales bacterium]|nr:MAG: hypothetical protein EOP52_02995 [Sphingobacteriales bacterium]